MTDELKQIADAISRLTDLQEKQVHTKAPAAMNTATLLHGLGGIFSVAGLEREIITAHIRPHPGLGAVLPVYPTLYTDPRFGSITGVSDDIGSEPSFPCDDAPTRYLKGCNLTAAFGRYARSTETIEIDRVIEMLHRGETSDLRLYGDLLTGGRLSPGLSQGDVLSSVTKSQMIMVGVAFERLLNTQTWTGNPANNNVGGGYKEFPGLDRQIATGQVDADTNTTCPSLDSDVKSFAYNDVCGTGLDIVEYLSAMEHYLRNNADRMGHSPVTWVIVMRPDLWQELSSCWPCKYLTDNCFRKDGTSPMVINDNANINLRDAMRNGPFLPINGVNYPVILDDGIYEYNNINNANLKAGEYASSIYFVPITIAGGLSVCYWEHKDYTKITPDVTAARNKPTFWSDDGRFMWAYEETKFCYKLTAKIEPRIVLRTPQLAGKLQYVKYIPLQHVRDSDPDSPYWADGGVSLRTNRTSYAVWGTGSR